MLFDSFFFLSLSLEKLSCRNLLVYSRKKNRSLLHNHFCKSNSISTCCTKLERKWLIFQLNNLDSMLKFYTGCSQQYKSFFDCTVFFGISMEKWQLNFPGNLTTRRNEHIQKWIYSSESWFTNATHLAWFKFYTHTHTETHELMCVQKKIIKLSIICVSHTATSHINEFKIVTHILFDVRWSQML